ncbi:DNA-binding transcriptional regulator, FadR family [Butyrivibrio fibrisolvens DSM 3071]|uniref:DNA-binding transcriptional regulator, FadR family n=1 Tax=Butyrivibrio fibrisolvens DSM 3071 TaxID=1121131 RepID=A0A1M5PIV1_BUTFI|nr:GntR family transcriptional regulator [Butyrivibrio fibrisolvens]SHH01694.1 DNA-binding transcriptional regulator, FadR family [Butyrivibrio fibrisolvens DSM 3071]
MEKNKSSREIVTKRITEMILTGQLKPDDQLPPERELAESMGISRNLCADIIKELEKKGLLVVVPRQGVFVNDFRKNGNIHTLEALMKADFELQPKEIASIIEYKWGIETLTCKRVIQNATDEEIERLGKFLDNILEADSPNKAALCAYEYYHELAVLSGNTIVPMLTAGFKKVTVGLWTRYAQNYGTQQLYKSLAEVYFYINKRDFDGVIRQISQSTTDTISGDYSIYKQFPH